jgi:nucleotide-binding universal stress UspA family protein
MKAQTILLGTDFSVSSQLAFEVASALAHQSGAKLLVVHVEQGQPSMGPAYYDIPDPGIAEMARKLAALKPPAPDVPVEHRIERGDPAAEILRIAAGEPIDMVVVGSRGRSALPRLLLGSVATTLLRKAPCPILVCHPADAPRDSHD